MLKPELLDQVEDRQYRFCGSPQCLVVYFSPERCYSTGDLRTRVGLKEKDDPLPVCYCFGFDVQALREEIKVKGFTTIPRRVSALVKARLCACEERNPSGACCLGELTKVVKSLMQEAR